jgi:hypothetical protein
MHEKCFKSREQNILRCAIGVTNTGTLQKQNEKVRSIFI